MLVPNGRRSISKIMALSSRLYPRRSALGRQISGRCAAKVGVADLFGPTAGGFQASGTGKMPVAPGDRSPPKSQINTGSNAGPTSLSTAAGSLTPSDLGGRGGGQITQRPSLSASSRISWAGSLFSQTVLKPNCFKRASGSPWCSIARGKKGRPSTVSTEPDSFTSCRLGWMGTNGAVREGSLPAKSLA